MYVSGLKPSQGILGQKHAIVPQRQFSGAALALDQVLFGASTRRISKVPDSAFVEQAIGRHLSFMAEQVTGKGIQLDTLQITDKPIHESVAVYDYAKHKATVRSAERLIYLVLGEDKAGNLVPAFDVHLSKEPAKGNWQVSQIRWDWPLQKPFFDAAREAMKHHPDAEIHSVSGVGGAIGSIGALMVQKKNQPAEIQVLHTTNSVYPGTYPEDRYPLKPGDVLTQADFMNKLNQAGRLDEEGMVLVMLFSNKPEDKKVLAEMIGVRQAQQLIKATEPLKQRPFPENETLISNLIQEKLATRTIKMTPYLSTQGFGAPPPTAEIGDEATG